MFKGNWGPLLIYQVTMGKSVRKEFCQLKRKIKNNINININEKER